jgi:hypothetical protein
MSDTTPNKKLRELVESWRERNWSGWSHPRDGAYQAANELEEVIEE